MSLASTCALTAIGSLLGARFSQTNYVVQWVYNTGVVGTKGDTNSFADAKNADVHADKSGNRIRPRNEIAFVL